MDTRAIWARRLAIATAIGMLVVLLIGAHVAATGSGEGCGTDWPLCYGRFLPEQTYHSIAEYSHRVAAGSVTVLVLGTAILAWPLRRGHRSFTVLVPAMAIALVLQALVGAAVVVWWPIPPAVISIHLGIALICLASAALIAIILAEAGTERERRTLHSVPNAFRLFLVGTLVLSIGVAYSGAYVRFSGAQLACTSWPTCNGKLIPSYEGISGIQAMHRTAAGLFGLIVLALAIWGYTLRQTRPDVAWIGGIALAIVLGQVAVGGIVVYSGLQLLAQLAHTALMAALFVTLSDGVRRVWVNRPQHFPKAGPAPAPGGVTAG